MRTTARLPPVNGIAPDVGVGESVRVGVGVIVPVRVLDGDREPVGESDEDAVEETELERVRSEVDV